MEVVKQGCSKRIGGGGTVSVRNDTWVLDRLLDKVSDIQIVEEENALRVGNLIRSEC